jgi:hypothetical protein
MDRASVAAARNDESISRARVRKTPATSLRMSRDGRFGERQSARATSNPDRSVCQDVLARAHGVEGDYCFVTGRRGRPSDFMIAAANLISSRSGRLKSTSFVSSGHNGFTPANCTCW